MADSSVIPQITIPRLDNESTRAYAARVAYLTMGPERSITGVAQRLHKSHAIMSRWNSRHRWSEHARQYDETMATIAARIAAREYKNELESHRKRYQDIGQELYDVAARMLVILKSQLDRLEYTPSTIALISRAVLVAADLEAHALQVQQLLPQLTDDLSDSE